MAEQTTGTDPAHDQVCLAFRLGWTTAELLGRLRRGIRRPGTRSPSQPRDDDYAPRLSVSNGNVTGQGEQFLLAARRLGDLADALKLWPDGPATARQPVQRLPQDIERWLKGAEVRAMTPAALRELLEGWSLEAWSRLHARNDTLARALTAGMSLADTYWYLRRPPRGREPDLRPAEETWRRLLSMYRLDAERGRMQDLAADLPAGVSHVLRHHLRSWSIGTELYYDHGGHLRRLAWPFRRSLPVGLLYRWRKAGEDLKAEDERAIQDDLGRQAEVWQALVFGLRRPESYLYPRDLSLALWGTRLLFFVFLLLPLALVSAAAIYGLALLLGGIVVPSLLTTFQETVSQGTVSNWSDLLKLVSSALAAVATVIAAAVPLWRWLQRANERIHHELTAFFIARRTLTPWNRTLHKKEKKRAAKQS